MSLDWAGAWQALIHHPLFGIGITLGAYQLAMSAYERTRWIFLQPVLISMLLVISVLLLCQINFTQYWRSVEPLTLLLGPTTVALAVPLYLNLKRIRQLFWPIVMTLAVAGSLATFLGFGLMWLFGGEDVLVKSMAPKSVTSPIAMLVADQIGGTAALAAVFVMLTGVIGAMFGPWLLRLCRVEHPAAVGLALGISAHAVGTARALQENEECGAFSALAMGLMGILTAILMPLIYLLLI